MPRFQSRLFNWIDQSLPAQLGRSVRRSIDQKLRQIAGLPIQELPRLLAYQVAKAALYPVYLIASTAKRTFPALNRGKNSVREELRSQPDPIGLLPETELIAKDITDNQDSPQPEIPLFWRPLAKFLNWIDAAKTKLDQNISAIVKRSADNLATVETEEVEPKLIANRFFAEIWKQEVEQRQAAQNVIKNAIKENNGLAESVALGENTRMARLRRLIEAAIAYFFGKQPAAQSQSLGEDQDNLEDPEIVGTDTSNVDSLPDSQKLRRRGVRSASVRSNMPLSRRPSLDRLRELIAAAIDYFIGKRALDGDVDNNVDRAGEIDGTQPDLLIGKVIEKLQKRATSSPKRNQNDASVTPDYDDSLKFDNQLERLQKLIEAAIDYFLHRRSQPSLEETTDIAPSEEAWLTMEEVFGNDNGPWPMPLEYESIAFSKSPDRHVIHSSGELQHFETTTTQISQDRLDGSLVFDDDEFRLYQKKQEPDIDGERPLRAWIEARATILGYAYNPVMTVILWVDAVILKIEDWIIAIWKGLINFPKKFFKFVRYGKKKSKK